MVRAHPLPPGLAGDDGKDAYLGPHSTEASRWDPPRATSCGEPVISDTIVAMLHTRQRYAEFTKKEIADSARTSEVLLALSSESREKVDELVERAVAAGGSVSGETQDQGFMYGRAFDDPDGHTWEIAWMDPSVVEG